MIEKKDILYEIYQNKEGIDVFDLLYKLELTYKELRPILEEYLKEGLLKTDDGKLYRFVGDGGMFSEEFRKESLQRFVDNLIDRSVGWDRDDEDDDADEETVDIERDGDFYAKFHRNVMRDRRAQYFRASGEGFVPVEGPDGDDDEDENDENCDEDEEIGEGFSEERFRKEAMEVEFPQSVRAAIAEGVSVAVENGQYFIGVGGIHLFGKEASFELFSCDKDIFLGVPKSLLLPDGEDSAAPEDEETKRFFTYMREEYGLLEREGRLCVSIAEPDETLAGLMRLYSIIERLVRASEASHGAASKGTGDVPEEFLVILEHVVQLRSASFTEVNRSLGIAFHTIGECFEWMEQMGFVTSFDQNVGRKVLLTPEEYARRFGKK